MKSVQIENVPDTVCEVLERRAADAGLTLSDYLLATMREMASRPSMEEVLRRARARGGAEISQAELIGLVRAQRRSS